MAVTDNNRPPAALPPGTRLDEFELRRVLGIGGFGIVYLAFDHALEREVAIKEYMPSSLVGRSDGSKVLLHGESHAESFSLGLRSFVNEARLLARFDAPGLVKVHRYWEANNTAYMAMPYYAGSNLHAVRRRMDKAPDEAWLRKLLEPLLDALERLHSAGIYHRDISPDNVILQPDGQPVLLDFGAARRVITDKSVALTAILKPAYAPIEQYAEAGAVKQGAWTDLYALGATLHFLLMGRAPPPATARAVEDEMPPLARQPALLAICSPGFLQAVDWMLKPRPADRPQSVAALREALVPRPAPPEDDDRTILDLSRLSPTPEPDSEATVMLPRRDEATVLIPRKTPPAPPVAPRDEATILMPRRDEPTVLMPRRGDAPPPPPGGDEPTILMPRRDAPTQEDVHLLLPLDEEATVILPRRGDHEPTMRMPPPGSARPAAGAPTPPPLHATRETTMPRPAERQSPVVLIGVVVALVLAAVVGWLVLKPAPQPAPAAAETPAAPASAAAEPAASAPVDTASAAGVAPAAAVVVPALVAPAAPAPAPARTEPTRKDSRPADTKPTRKEAAAAREPAPVVETPAAAPAGGPPSLATSITRLPPSDPVPVANPARPMPEPARQAAASPAPASAAAPATAAPRGGDTPVPRAAARDSEPVLLQTRALSPTERCEGRTAQALATCIERICRSEPGQREHADCVKARAAR